MPVPDVASSATAAMRSSRRAINVLNFARSCRE